ncbi:hypothetical protein OGR47_03980 [Methylocystis sp. MJC1]|jgi:hypothetical protein|uniref:hypothetical protein n=1 Tax=Methylocystis sp. MJC1 TaxID=2654282 RepID=UPI0013E9CB54|nr:hypothetical protein [Methylocystis sp. MJC1]KAF2991285.1 hypothetical protein MJC1_01634 [Methylocystis sp. MJC1]MBU6526175.1 hypothetical protein [Methylocystis sp. MJC1]UZX12629.1 hypothetical protein OGR47_03980 [Methylocystis sp. MJC1]
MIDAAKRLLPDAAFASVGGADKDARSAKDSRLDMMLVSGGDERIWPDPVTRRNRYGVPAAPAPEELWFSSSTASAASPRGYDAAREAFESVSRPGVDLLGWFDKIRARIVAQFGEPGVEVVLTASGTEAELAALAVAKALLRRPIANIVVAPDETGSGVALAATGAHFAGTAAFEPKVEKGAPLAGWENDDVVMRRLDIRDPSGRPRAAAEIDRAAGLAVAEALRTGRGALLHLLDASKTGRSGPSRAAARDILASARERAIILVDACQLRCSFDEIKADLAAGFLVMITGSKFVGGPPFCGALLIPADKAEKLRKMTLPPGLAAYAAQSDWPQSFGRAFEAENFAPANLGLGLRWTAALAEIEAYAKISSSLRDEIKMRFAEAARRGVAGNADLDFLDGENWRLGGKPATLFPILTNQGDPAQARLIYDSLRATSGAFVDAEYSRVCHVGQPVLIGGRAALRLCLGMPQVTAVAQRVGQGLDLDAAFLPLRRDMEFLFRKWGALARRIAANGGPTLAASN